MKTEQTRQTNRGFTLVELLVVIAIIALLVALLLPALARAREHAKSLKCIARLTDLGQALFLYANDNGGHVPTGWRGTGNHPDAGRWFFKLRMYFDLRWQSSGANSSPYDYLGYFCPKYEKVPGTTPMAPALKLASMYSYNHYFIGPRCNPETGWRSIDQAKLPGELPMFYDTRFYDFSHGSGGGGWPYPHPAAFKYGWNDGDIDMMLVHNGGPGLQHYGNTNYLFGDGHAKSMGLWPFESTKHAPQSRDYYRKYWHPRRDLNIEPCE